MNAALRFSLRPVLCVKVITGLFLNVDCTCPQIELTPVPVCWQPLHIALDVLLAGGQILDAALLFAMNNLGGQNCTKVFLFKVNLC